MSVDKTEERDRKRDEIKKGKKERKGEGNK